MFSGFERRSRPDTSLARAGTFDGCEVTRFSEIMRCEILLAVGLVLLASVLGGCAPNVGETPFESTQRARRLAQGTDDGRYARLTTRTGQSRFWPETEQQCIIFHHADDAPVDLPGQAAHAAVSRAIKSWSAAAQGCGAQVCLHLADEQLDFDGRGYDRTQDNANLITYVQDIDAWNALPGASPSAFALTVSTYRSATGHLLDTDVFVNQAAYRFAATDDALDDETVDLESVVLHEIGHALGFGHPPRTTRSVMRTNFFEGTVRRALYPTDIKGVCETYAAAEVGVHHDG